MGAEGLEHFVFQVSCFPSHFFTCFFACLSLLSFLQCLLADGGDEGGVDGGVATHSRLAEHLSANAGSGQS